MDGTAEAHNISFGCGRSAINIGPLVEDMIGGRWRYPLFEQRSGGIKKNEGVGCQQPSFHLRSNQPSSPASFQRPATPGSPAFSGTLETKTSVKQK